MTVEEWLETVEWITVRWASFASKEPIVIEAMYTDLRAYDGRDVQGAVEALWRGGREHAPTGGVILAQLRNEGKGPAINPTPPEDCNHVWAMPRRFEIADVPAICVRCDAERMITTRKVSA